MVSEIFENNRTVVIIIMAEKLHEGQNFSTKSLVVSTKKNLKNCKSCEDSGTKDDDDLVKENSLALVPFKKLDDAPPSYSIVVRNSHSSQLKPGWSLLRQVFHPRKHSPKSLRKNAFDFQRASRHPSWHSSAVVHPDHKKTNDDRNDASSLDEESGAIIPFGSDATFPPPSISGEVTSLPEELLGLQEKYSSSCRLYSLQELVSTTANFSSGSLSSLQLWFPYLHLVTFLGCLLINILNLFSENLVGKGGSSYVYRGCLPDGKDLAVKILKPSEDVIKDFVQEIEIITTLRHKNIISLSGFCFEGNHLLLVYNFLSRGSLEENLHGRYLFAIVC